MRRSNLSAALATTIALTLNACGGGESRQSSDPEVLDMKTKVLTPRGSAPIVLGNILTGSSRGYYGDFSVIPVEQTSSCGHPRMTSKAKIVHIDKYAGRSNNEGSMYVVYEREDGTAKKIESMEITTIVVTETEHPVYLIISNYEPTLFNLQLAEGAVVEGISLRTYNPSAVANGPDDPNAYGFITHTKGVQEKCWEDPHAYYSIAEQRKVVTAQPLTESDYKRLAVKETDYKQWMSWLERNYRRRIDLDMSAYSVSAVLVGPMPTEPLTQRPITGNVYATSIPAILGACPAGERIIPVKSSNTDLKDRYPNYFDKEKRDAMRLAHRQKNMNCRSIRDKVTRGGRQ